FASAGKPHTRFGKVAVPGSKNDCSCRPFYFGKSKPRPTGWGKSRGHAAQRVCVGAGPRSGPTIVRESADVLKPRRFEERFPLRPLGSFRAASFIWRKTRAR